LILLELGGAAGVNVPASLVFLKIAFESESTSLKISPSGGQSQRKTRKSLCEACCIRI
jgi:hypothetical protein